MLDPHPFRPRVIDDIVRTRLDTPTPPPDHSEQTQDTEE